MMQFKHLVQTNQKFRKSVNLQLDLGDYGRIESYIPTRSTVAVLERYFSEITGGTENAALLIGPYGKGKSHLLLVLLALLLGKTIENDLLLEKITKTDREAGQKISSVLNTGVRYLPVLINPTPGNDLNHTFVTALREALIRSGLADLAPESYYSEALKTIEGWIAAYPETFGKFERVLEEEGVTWADFKDSLKRQDKKRLDFFVEKYPQLTAGSTFAPMLRTGALELYQQVLRLLTENYGYSGIFIVFDEFSKYMEGHAKEGLSNDMKILQDMCELANSSGRGLFLTLVAHKSIREYGKAISGEAKNIFRGVEGRLTELEFVVSAQNNYELIADAVIKCEPQFSKEYASLMQDEVYCELLEESRQLACFQKLFMQEEFQTLIGRGCFPMVPLFVYALLHISEKVAQNERTIFTFLADEGQGSLSWLLARGQQELIGIDKIYDYFKNLFREASDQPQIHNEWLKTEDALTQTENDTQKAVIKAIAVIRMIHREEELPARDREIRLGLALNQEDYQEAMRCLTEREIIVYRSSIGVYAFRNNVGVNIEKTIQKKAAELGNRKLVCSILKKVLEMEYELPRQYNQKYTITRFFQYVFMETEDFLHLSAAQYLFDEEFADGKMIAVLQRGHDERERLQKHLDELKDERLLLLVSEQEFTLEPLLMRYEAVARLKQDESFLDGNPILLQELSLYEEDIAFEINAKAEEDYLPENGNVWVLRPQMTSVQPENAAAFGSILSEICEMYYHCSPRVNHELLNIQTVGSQYQRARNMVIKSILEGNSCAEYLEGTSPQAMVYRAAFVHTKEDAGCLSVFEELEQFLQKCAGKKYAFQYLYKRLSGKNYGVRKGIIPLFLAKKLADMEATAVIYAGNRELEVSYESLNQVNEQPQSYELYLEPETADKEQYLKKLEILYGEEISPAATKQGRLHEIVVCMQKWYRSLPQYTMVTRQFEPGMAGKIIVFRNALKRADVNARELLFDYLPAELASNSYAAAAVAVKQCKEMLDQALDILVKETAGKIKALFGVSADSNMKACLVEWYQNQSASSKNYILSTSVSAFMKYLEQLETNDEKEIVARLSRIVLDIYIEDWRDGTCERFLGELCRMKNQIEEIHDESDETVRQNRIILKDARGNKIEKYYDVDAADSTSLYLKNVMSEALEEFGDTLEINQKVAVLAEMLEELLQ